MSQMSTTGLHYICLLFIYLASLFQNKPSDRRFIMLLFFLFIYKTFETFMFQDDTSFTEITYEPSFLIVLSIGIIGMIIYVIISKKLYKLIEISLFIPLFFLPFNYVYIILSMFIFSLFYLIY